MEDRAEQPQPLFSGMLGRFLVVHGSHLFGKHRGIIADAGGVAPVHYLTRRLAYRRREYFAQMVRLRQRFGWRVNTTRYLLANEANRDTVVFLLEHHILTNETRPDDDNFLMVHRVRGLLDPDDHRALLDAIDETETALDRAEAVLADVLRLLLDELQCIAGGWSNNSQRYMLGTAPQDVSINLARWAARSAPPALVSGHSEGVNRA